MLKTLSHSKAEWRTLLILGRASNLPTVWSNCLAGWLLGGGGELGRLSLLSMGATFLYLGGMFMNDACDASFDAQYRRERPIPSGKISLIMVWIWSVVWLASGLIFLLPLGKSSGLLAILLLGCIVLYDLIHKLITFSPVLIAVCRFFLYLLAASAGAKGISGPAIWSALALAAYVTGLSYLARTESTKSAFRHWPVVLLAVPIVLALLVNDGPYLSLGLFFSVVLGGWIVWCLRFTLWLPSANITHTVSGLLAGIILVDLLALGGGSALLLMIYLVFFAAALLFQRFIPAT